MPLKRLSIADWENSDAMVDFRMLMRENAERERLRLIQEQILEQSADGTEDDSDDSDYGETDDSEHAHKVSRWLC